MADQPTFKAVDFGGRGGASAAVRASSGIGPRSLLFVLLAAILVVLTLVPLITVLVASFRPTGLPLSQGWTLHHYVAVWSSAYTYRLVLNTLVFAVGSTAFALVVAAALSWLLERTDLPGRNLFRAAILMPMVMPPLLLAIGWTLILSPRIGIVALGLQRLFGPLPWLDIYSLPGMTLVQGLAYVPTAVLMFSPVIRNMDPAYEEAARAARAGGWQTMVRVSFPFLLPAALSVATILILVGMLTFDVPAIIGMPGNVMVMSSEVFQMMTPPEGMPEYGRSAALNGSLFVLLIVGLVVYWRATGSTARFATISGKGYKSVRLALGKWRRAATAFVVLYFVVAVILPFLALLWASLMPYFTGFDLALASKLSFSAYGDVLTSARVWQAGAHAAVIAIAAAVGLTVLSLAVSWVILRSRVRWARLLDVLAMIPIGIPPLMMGVALIFLFFSFRAIPLYGTIWIIALGHLIIYLPVASRMMQAGMMQIGRELEEAAVVAGASLMQNLRRIVAPLLRPTLVALMIWVIVHSLREFSIAVMLQSGRNQVLSTILYDDWENGKPEHAAAIAVMLMAVLSVLVAFSSRLAREGSER